MFSVNSISKKQTRVDDDTKKDISVNSLKRIAILGQKLVIKDFIK